MHTPLLVTANLVYALGSLFMPVFLMVFFGSLFFRRSRTFSIRLILGSLLLGLLTGAILVLEGRSYLPPPYDTRIFIPGFIFGFGSSGIAYFFWLLFKKRPAPQGNSDIA